jgi:hypothetical protein
MAAQRNASSGGSKPSDDSEDPDTTQDVADTGGVEEPEEPEDDETWFSSLDPAVKSRVEQWHETKVTGLKSALGAERKNGTKLEKELRQAATLAEKGSQLQKQLEQAANDLQAERGRAQFYEEAQTEQVLPGYARVLYSAAQTEDYQNARGGVDWKALRRDYPAMFASERKPKGNAGNGIETSGAATGRRDMNALFRQQVRDKK